MAKQLAALTRLVATSLAAQSAEAVDPALRDSSLTCSSLVSYTCSCCSHGLLESPLAVTIPLPAPVAAPVDLVSWNTQPHRPPITAQTLLAIHC